MQPHLGEQWEEFMKYASDLQRQMAQGMGQLMMRQLAILLKHVWV